MTVSARPLLALALLIPATGCGDTAGDPRPVTVVDSAGVEVVTNLLAPASFPVRDLPPAPQREVIHDALYRVTALHPFEDGRVAVGASGSSAVLVFDSDGALVATLGRAGEGPGELVSIGGVVPLPGDSLGVWDPRQRRLTVFPPEGGAPRVTSLADLIQGSGWSRILPLDEGMALVGEGGLGSGPRDPGVYRLEEPSYRVSAAGEVLATYGLFPGLEAVRSPGLIGRAPFGALLATATWVDRFVVGTAEKPELRVFGPDATLERIIRWPDTDRTVTRARMDAFIEFQMERLPPEQAGAAGAVREILAQLPFAPRMPAHADIVAAPDGTLWVAEYAGPEAEFPGTRPPAGSWMVFDAGGILTHRVRTPEGFRPFALTDDLVWGVYQDELDVERVRAYRRAEG